MKPAKDQREFFIKSVTIQGLRDRARTVGEQAAKLKELRACSQTKLPGPESPCLQSLPITTPG